MPQAKLSRPGGSHATDGAKQANPGATDAPPPFVNFAGSSARGRRGRQSRRRVSSNRTAMSARATTSRSSTRFSRFGTRPAPRSSRRSPDRPFRGPGRSVRRNELQRCRHGHSLRRARRPLDPRLRSLRLRFRPAVPPLRGGVGVVGSGRRLERYDFDAGAVCRAGLRLGVWPTGYFLTYDNLDGSFTDIGGSSVAVRSGRVDRGIRGRHSASICPACSAWSRRTSTAA